MSATASNEGVNWGTPTSQTATGWSPMPFRETTELTEIKQKIKEQQTNIQQVLTRLKQIEQKIDKYSELIDIKVELAEQERRILQLFEAKLLQK